MSTSQLILELKENNQDFEYYPTTNEILECISLHIKNYNNSNRFSLLDIGAGDCRLYNYLKTNNNLHIKFDTEFMKAWSIEAGRLLGWIKDKSQVMEEMEDITIEDVDKYFKSNKTISLVNSNILMLGE